MILLIQVSSLRCLRTGGGSLATILIHGWVILTDGVEANSRLWQVLAHDRITTSGPCKTFLIRAIVPTPALRGAQSRTNGREQVPLHDRTLQDGVHVLIRILTGGTVPDHRLMDASTQRLLGEADTSATHHVEATGRGIRQEFAAKASILAPDLAGQTVGDVWCSTERETLGVVQTDHLYGCRGGSNHEVRLRDALKVVVQGHVLNLLQWHPRRDERVLHRLRP